MDKSIFKNPIDRNSVVSSIIEAIKVGLISGELKPGTFLPSETELTNQLGVGKSSVREAIKMLQAMGVVDVVRGQGTIIKTEPGKSFWEAVSFQMLLAGQITDDLFQFRLMFEPAYTILAMNNYNDEDIKEIKQTINDLESAVKNNENTSIHDLNFHKAILNATHSPMTVAIGNTLMELIRPAVETSMKTLPEVALKDHLAILNGLINKNEQQIVKAIYESSKSWETYMTFNKKK